MEIPMLNFSVLIYHLIAKEISLHIFSLNEVKIILNHISFYNYFHNTKNSPLNSFIKTIKTNYKF